MNFNGDAMRKTRFLELLGAVCFSAATVGCDGRLQAQEGCDTPACEPTGAPAITKLFSQFHLTGETLSEYYLFNSKSTGLIVAKTTGKPITQWKSSPGTRWGTDFAWVDPNHPPASDKLVSVEERGVRFNCAGGKDFVWVDAYRAVNPISLHSVRFPIKTTRAEMRVANGPWVDITGGGTCGKNGQPYAPHDVPIEPYSLRVWGEIYKADGVTVGRQFFWQNLMVYTTTVTNACWTMSSNNVRNAVKHQEASWDSSVGWAIGRGNLDQKGIPDGENVTLGRWSMIAKGAGIGWLAALSGNSDGPADSCLQSTLPW